jgi:hypothetical protein
MKEITERKIKIGFTRSAKAVVDNIEKTVQEMAAQGWKLSETKTDEILGNIFLSFEREIPEHKL